MKITRILAFTNALLAGVWGCSDPRASPDAGTFMPSDATSSHDARPSTYVDAPTSPDAAITAPDAAITVPCPPGQFCFQLAPVDGVTNLPAGRLAIAWFADDAGQSKIEVAYDQPWVPASITKIDITQIMAPSAAVQATGIPSCTSSYAASIAVLSTDPDASGSISAAEILNGQTSNTTYGVHQQMIAWFSDACDPLPPDFPEGFAKGIHVYSADTPVHRLDGIATSLQTCEPGTSACANLQYPD
jgi:hypothetical protein